jgi:FkbM family methyltransferase
MRMKQMLELGLLAIFLFGFRCWVIQQLRGSRNGPSLSLHLQLNDLWFPPNVQKLRQCNPGRSMCRAYALLSAQTGSDENSWQQLHEFYVRQLRLVPDERSRMTIKYVLDVSYCYYHFAHAVPVTFFALALREADNFTAEIPTLRRTFPWRSWRGRPPHMEAFYYAHGLRFCSQSIRDYVRNRDFIDCGAFDGDSLSVLSEYTRKRIISYEIFEGTWKIANATTSYFAPGKHIVLLKGLGKANSVVYLSPTGGGASGIWNSKGSIPIEITTLDHEAERLGLDVGFIKVDIEGEELNFLQGALRTLRTHHPVTNVAIYHTADLLNIPQFFDQFGGFRLMFHTESDGLGDNLHDLRLFAIPANLQS